MPAGVTGATPNITFDVLLFEQLIAAACNSVGITSVATRDAFIATATQAQFNAFTQILMKCVTFGAPRQ